MLHPQRSVVGVVLVLVALFVALSPARGDILVAPYASPPRILVHADGATGDAAPLRVLQGTSTLISGQAQAIAVDSPHQEFWVTSGGSLNVYPIDAAGNHAPLRQISSTELVVPVGVALDLTHDEVVAGSYASGTADAIVVFQRAGNGIIAPLRKIAGPATGIHGIYSVAVDPAANEIYATVGDSTGAILVFARTANGDVAPLRRIAGPHTGLGAPMSIALDAVHNELVVCDLYQPAIFVFARGATGDVAPLRRIMGDHTRLRNVRGVTLLGDIEILAANGGAGAGEDSVLAFPRTANGNVAPSRVLTGPSTQLRQNYGIAVYHPSLRLGGGRFAVEATWKTLTGGVGGGAPTALTADTGDFWFFGPSNIEAVVKVLNGCGTNQRFWFFAGGLTNVLTSLRVTDLTSGRVRVYTKPQATAFQPIQDTQAFATCGFASTAPMPEEAAVEAADDTGLATDSDGPAGSAAPSCTGLCLGGGRFQVTASWAAGGQSGVATPVPRTVDTGYLWFFKASNLEVVVKVLNGCSLNSRYWVFAGGLTNVQVDLTVTDLAHGTPKVYHNLQGTAFQPIQDTAAFATCP